MNGAIIEARKSHSTLDPHSYLIKGDDNNVYFAHMGDLLSNEGCLYGKCNRIEVLEVGGRVKFSIPNEPFQHVLHVEKINDY